MRLFVADIAGVCDAGKTVADAAAAEHGVNSAVGVGNHRNGILPAKAIQRLARAGQDLVPVRGILRVLDQGIAHAIVHGAAPLQQICMKGPPEAVVDSAAHQALIEFLLGAAL
jgi:S-adenosylmethionine synthetase